MKIAREELNFIVIDNMSIVNALIRKFEKFIGEINADNILIGGTSALTLHGLNLSRPVEDLDIVIYSPTESQKEQLANLKWLSIEEDGYPTDNLKISKGHKIINILLEKDEKMPTNLLSYKGIPIQSISGVIEAKRSYSARPKDMADYIDLAKNFL
jgi:hypothetical protein